MRLTGAKASLGRFLESCPAGWDIANFGEIADTQLGKMLSQKTRPAGNPKPYLRNKNVQWGKFDLSDVWTLEIRSDEAKRFRLAVGDLLVCEGGEVGRAAIWNGEIAECYYQKALHRVRPGRRATARYLYWVLTLYKARNLFQGFSTGTTISHLPQEALRELPVPLPPLEEQRRITEAIDGHVTTIEAAASMIKGALTRSGSLRRKILAAAFPVLQTMDSTESLRGGWQIKTLAQVARWGSGGTPKSTNAEFYGGDIPWAVTGDLNDSVVFETAGSITRSGLDSSSAKQVEPGCVLVAMYGASIGRLGITGRRMATNQAIAIADPLLDVIETKYLFWWLYHQRPVLRAAGKGAAQPNISQQMLKALRIPVAPLREQRSIVAHIERQISRISTAESGLKLGLTKSNRLRSAIVAAAFTGKLVKTSLVDQTVRGMQTSGLAR